MHPKQGKETRKSGLHHGVHIAEGIVRLRAETVQRCRSYLAARSLLKKVRE